MADERRRMIEAAEQYGRGRSLQKVRAGVAAVTVWALSIQLATAQESPSAEETAAARSIALEGIRLADAGRCEEAIDKLTRAEKLHHAPVVLGRLGECQVLRGQLVEGTETLRKVLREALPPDAPAVLVKARERAQSVLEKAKGRIGALNISVKGPTDTAAVVVSVDGERMNAALLDVDRPTDPGDHLIEASAPGFSSTSSRVSLAAGARQNIIIELVQDPNATVAAASVATPPAPARLGAVPEASAVASPPSVLSVEASTAPAPPRAPDHTAAFISWAVGGAGLVTGSVLGLMVLDRKGDLNEQCPAHECPESSRDKLESTRGIGTAATVSFVVAGAALGLGTFFYFNAEPKEDRPAGPDARRQGLTRTSAAPRARAWIGLGSIGVSGDF
jgi:hypothetical protein